MLSRTCWSIGCYFKHSVNTLHNNPNLTLSPAGTFEGIANTLHRELDKSITAIEKLDRHRRDTRELVEVNVAKIRDMERKITIKVCVSGLL